jgi:hypothetical protein
MKTTADPAAIRAAAKTLVNMDFVHLMVNF